MSERRKGRLGGFELLAQDAADDAYRGVMMLRDEAYGDSPIECLFFAALVTVAGQGGRMITKIFKCYGPEGVEYNWDISTALDHPTSVAMVERQVQVAGWRVDFVIHYEAWDKQGNHARARLLVECDGHEFHERTKEQAARDRARDRLAQHEGLPIFRFTGSEIWNDPTGCADEVLAFMGRL